MKKYEIKTIFTAVDKMSKSVGHMRGGIGKFVASASMGMRKLDGVTTAIGASMFRVAKYGFAAATGAAVGLYAAVSKTAQGMDDLAKTTRAMNFPIEEFQEFRFAAEQSGVSTEGFTTATMKFTKNVGDLKAGTGSLYTILKKTDPKLLSQMKKTENMADAFDLYLGAIHKAPNEFKKASMSVAAFGRSGMKMTLLANNSAEAMEALRAEMRENGVVTAEQAALAEAFDDKMNRLKLTVKGFAVGALTPLMPLLTEGGEKVRLWMVANRDLVGSKIKHYFEWLVNNHGMIIEKMKLIGKLVIGFYAIAAIVKVVNVTLAVTNLALLAISKFRGGSVSGELGKVGDAAGGATGKVNALLRGIGGVAVAAGIGWTVGSLIHTHIVEPIMSAQAALDRARQDLQDTMGRDLSKRSKEQLMADVENAKKVYEASKAQSRTAMASDEDEKIVVQRAQDLKRLENALQVKDQTEKIEKYDPQMSFGAPAEWEVEPVGYSGRQVEQSLEITIKDETGRARVTNRKGAAVPSLIHTGAM